MSRASWFLAFIPFVLSGSNPAFGEGLAKKTPAEFCATEPAGSECRKCKDGFFTRYYYDRGAYRPEAGRLPDRKRCFGIRHFSECEPCSNSFEIAGKESFGSVSCETFYGELLKKNRACKGCIEIYGAYGG